MFGRLVDVPRWSETYGRDYLFSGTVQRAQPVPDHLAPLLDWSRQRIDQRLDGLLVNWYDGALGHSIGRHRDDEVDLVAGAPIVTISFGEGRRFRLRPWQGRGFHDIEVGDGSVLVLPYVTNVAYTHEVPASRKQQGRRISVTLRAFAPWAWTQQLCLAERNDVESRTSCHGSSIPVSRRLAALQQMPAKGQGRKSRHISIRSRLVF